MRHAAAMGYFFKLACFYFMIERAVAQVSKDPCVAPNPGFPTIDILSSDDIARIQPCTTINGTLSIQSYETFSLPNLVVVLGDLTIKDKILDKRQIGYASQNYSLSFPRLENITGALDIRSEMHRNLELPRLARANSIALTTPILESWTQAEFLQVNRIVVDQHNISDFNLGSLTDVTSIVVNFQDEGELYIYGTMGTDLERSSIRVTGTPGKIVGFNSHLDNTDRASFILQGCQSIMMSSKSLTTLQITDSPGLTSFSLDSLERILKGTDTGGIIIKDNQDLTTFSFSSLLKIDGKLRIANNSQIDTFGEGFPLLESVNGDLNVDGDFSSFYFPKPVKVGRSPTIKSSNTTFDCNTAQESFAKGTVINCSSPFTSPPIVTPPPKTKDTLSYPAKIGLSVAIAVLFVLSLCLGCGFCLWRSHRHGDGTGRAATISSKLMRLWAKESFNKTPPPSYPLGDYPRGTYAGRAGEEPPSYQARPSSTATTVVPDVRDGDVSRAGMGTGLGRILTGGRDHGGERSVSPLSAVEVERPTGTYRPPQGNRISSPPDYRP